MFEWFRRQRTDENGVTIFIGLLQVYCFNLSKEEPEPAGLQHLRFYADLPPEGKGVFKLAVACLKVVVITRILANKHDAAGRAMAKEFRQTVVDAYTEDMGGRAGDYVANLLQAYDEAFARPSEYCYNPNDAAWFLRPIDESLLLLRDDILLCAFIENHIHDASKILKNAISLKGRDAGISG